MPSVSQFEDRRRHCQLALDKVCARTAICQRLHLLVDAMATRTSSGRFTTGRIQNMGANRYTPRAQQSGSAASPGSALRARKMQHQYDRNELASPQQHVCRGQGPARRRRHGAALPIVPHAGAAHEHVQRPRLWPQPRARCRRAAGLPRSRAGMRSLLRPTDNP